MKRLISFSIAVLLMGVLSSPQAEAIFGLSKCEKVRKSIAAEEQVGLVFFKDYDKQRKILLKMSEPSISDWLNVLTWLPKVYESDNRVFILVEKNMNCFKATEIARARSEKSYNDKSIKDLNNIMKISTANSDLLKRTLMTKNQIDGLKKLYPNFFSFIDNKKLN